MATSPVLSFCDCRKAVDAAMIPDVPAPFPPLNFRLWAARGVLLTVLALIAVLAAIVLKG